MYFLTLFLEKIFNYIYLLTEDYGFSLILLGMVVNIILLPVYIALEPWKRKSIVKLDGLNRQIKEIKKNDKGQERYFNIQAIYRRFKYHHINSLRMYMGLLVQIPFFIAAYRMLSHYSGIEGVPFLFISDLSKPDNFSSLGTLPDNIFPIVMTMIN